MSWRWSIASGLLALSLTGCFAKSSDKIARELEQSVVLITYRDKPGHGTGFFVPGAKDVCMVLTAKHVLAPSSDLNLTLDREIISSDTKIQPQRDVDLAIVTFKPSKSKNCPYKPLKLGNSDRVEYGETISILGFPKREGDRNLVPQFTSGTVTRIEKLPLAEYPKNIQRFRRRAVLGPIALIARNSSGKQGPRHFTQGLIGVIIGHQRQYQGTTVATNFSFSTDNILPGRVRVHAIF